jgi:glycosyltransferase involved in cell wall biosynthesis
VKLSVVVPAFNEEKLLSRTLACIQAAAGVLAPRGWSHEVIVCDNNSTDRTAAIAREAGARVVFEPVNQISRARNAGAAAATGDWLLFVDADCSPSRELFEDLLTAMQKPGCVGGGTTVRLPDTRLDVRFWVGLWNALSRACGWAAGAFFFCRAREFRELGGFSEALYAAEEIDLSRRLKRRGRFVILHRHPLVTSARKAHLYSAAEHARFMLRVVASGGRSLRRRENCGIWYDGRR